MYMDIDGDGKVGTLDAKVVLTLIAATYASFPAVTIQ